MKKKLLSIVLAFSVALMSVPSLSLTAFAETQIHPNLNVSGGTEGTDYTWGGDILTSTSTTVPDSYTLVINTSTPLTLTGNNEVVYSGQHLAVNKISIPKGVTANLTIDGTTLYTGDSSDASPITVFSGGTLNLTLVGNNTFHQQMLADGSTMPAIRVVNGASLTITDKSTGSMTASSNNGAAVIGASKSSSDSTGKITVSGGTLNLTADCGDSITSYSGAAIGSNGNENSPFEEINITGGTINATSKTGAAIGDGKKDQYNSIVSGSINISGGNITAVNQKGNADGIGGSTDDYLTKTVIITGGNIQSSVRKTRPKDAAGTALYKTEVTLQDASSQAVKNTGVTGITAKCSGSVYTYSAQSITTDGNGKMYLWLPQNAAVLSAEAGGKSYGGDILTTADDSGSGVLKFTTATEDEKYLYDFSADLYDGALSEGGTVNVTVKDGSNTETFTRNMAVSNYHGSFSGAFYLPWQLTSGADVTVSGTAGGKTWSASDRATLANGKLTFSVGSKLIKTTLLFTASTITSNNFAFPVSQVTVSQGGTTLNGSDASKVESMVVPSSVTSYYTGKDNTCALTLWLPAGSANTDISVTIPQLNSGKAITQTGLSVTDGDSNIINLFKDNSYIYSYDADGIDQTCGAYQPAMQASDGYYEIANTGELYWFSEYVSKGNLGANARLTADITIAKKDGKNRSWIPIGYNVSGRCYSGTFDGNFHVISGLYLDTADTNGCTLGFVLNLTGMIKNLGLTNAVMACNPKYNDYQMVNSGFLCGEIVSTGTKIQNCYVVGSIANGVYTQGLCGYSARHSGGTVIKNCYTYFTGDTSRSYGIAGALIGGTENCFYYQAGKGSNYGTQKDANAFKSGEVCWLLNGSSTTGAFGQTLGTDSYPAFQKYTKTVYQDGTSYKNNNAYVTVGDASEITYNSAKIAVTGTANATLYYASSGSALTDGNAVASATGSQSIALSSSGSGTIALSGLTADTQYTYYFAVKSGSDYSDVRSVSFKTGMTAPAQSDVSVDYTNELFKAKAGLSYNLEYALTTNASSWTALTANGASLTQILNGHTGTDAINLFFRKHSSSGNETSAATQTEIPARPAVTKPTIISGGQTSVSITLNPVANAEYKLTKINGTDVQNPQYQDSNIFTNLNPATTYTFVQRTKAVEKSDGTDGNFASAESDPTEFSTAQLPVLYNGSNTLQEWYTSDVTVSAAGFTVSDSGTGTFTDSYVVSETCADKTLYFKNAGGSVTPFAVSVKIDKTAPTGKITVGASWWDKFLTTITFGYYHVDPNAVTIEASDSESGMKTVQYLIATDGTTYTQEQLAAKTNDDWQSYNANNKPALTEGQKSVVYAKIINNAGTVTYLSSDGMIFDNTPPTGTVKIGNNSFAKFLNTITFGYFFKDTQTATVTASDNGSGVASIKYQLVHNQSDYSENGAWTDYPSGGISLNPDSKYVVYAKITDNTGNYVIINSNGVIVDQTKPELALSVPSGWQTSDTMTVGVTAGDALAGVQSVSYTTNESAPQSGTISISNDSGNITLANEGDYNLTATATDNAGNSVSQTARIQWDKTKPTVTISGNPEKPVQSAKLSIAATAGASGIKSVTVSGPQGEKDITDSYQSGNTITANGSYVFTVTNNAGISVSSTPITVATIDAATPVVTINSNGYTDGAWTKNDVKIDISNSAENLGTTTLEYSTDSGKTWTAFDGSLTDSTEGITTYSFRVTSASGVVSDIKAITAKIDKTAPISMTISFKQNPFKSVAHFLSFGLFFGDTTDVNFSANDSNGSDIDHYEYQTVQAGSAFDAYGTWHTGFPSITPDFKGTVYARAVDKAGNVSDYVAKSFVVDKTAPVITANSGDSSLITLGAGASIPVEVKDNGAGIGTVTYQVNGSQTQTVDLTADSYSDLTKEYSLNINSLPDGVYDVTINATDNSGNSAATATVHVTKNAVQTGFGFASASISKTYGDEPFTVTATGGQSGGTVAYTVTNGTDVLSVDALTGKVTIQKAGTTVITAMKAAGAGYLQATAQLTVNVSKIATSVQTVPTVSGNIKVIGKLSSSKLTGGKASVPGTFTWTNPDAVITKTGNYDVTFTPLDTDNYSTVTCKVPVTVSPILTSSSSNAPQLDCSGITLPSGVTSVSMAGDVQNSDSSTNSDVKKIIGQDTSLGNLSGLTVYDLKLLDQNGNQIEPTSGKVRVKIAVPAGMSGNLKVFWYNSSDGTLTDMNATQENGYLVFETSHFSYYAIAAFKPSKTSSDTTSGSTSGKAENPHTGSGYETIIPVAMLLCGSAAGIVILKRKQIFRRKKGKV